MKEYRYYQNLCNAILAGKFNFSKYHNKKKYFAGTVAVKAYLPEGTVVLAVQFEDSVEHELHVIPAYNGVVIDGHNWKDVINILYLYEEGITLDGDRRVDVVRRLGGDPVWEEHPRSVELETYTSAGENMIIDLEEPTREKLEEYINDFDIDSNVSLWWNNGKPCDGVPFTHMSEQIRDYEKYLRQLKKVADKMPY